MLGSIISGIGSIAGGLIGANSASKDRAQQKEFAQNSVQWRAKDAKAAGLHPLATMGYSGSSYTPVGDGGMGSAVSQAGQALGSGIAAQPKNALAKQLGMSSMAVDAANIDLLKAQKLQILDNIRKSVQGTKGITTPLPSPLKYKGQNIPYSQGTSNAQEIEDKHGGLIGDLLSTLATIEGIDASKPNPFLYVQKSPFRSGKNTGKPKRNPRFQ